MIEPQETLGALSVRIIDGIRSVFFNIAFYFFSIGFLGLIVLPFCYIGSERAVRYLIDIYCRGARGIGRWVMGIRYEYRGLEHIPADTGFILAAAHQSNLDPIMTFPVRSGVTALAKKELFSTPIVGQILRKMGIIRIDRQAKNAHKAMQGVGQQVKENKNLLIIYPQGTRVPVGETKRLKAGAFHVHADTGLPVIPVATNTGLFWTKGFFHRSGKAIYEIHPPMAPETDKAAFMKKLEAVVVDRSHQLMSEAGYAALLPSPKMGNGDAP